MIIRFAGFGGQGIVLASYIMGRSAVLDGKKAIQNQSYGSESRGGECRGDAIIADEEIYELEPTNYDVLVALTQPAYEKFIPFLQPEGTLILDMDLVVTDSKLEPRGIKKYAIAATDIASKKLERFTRIHPRQRSETLKNTRDHPQFSENLSQVFIQRAQRIVSQNTQRIPPQSVQDWGGRFIVTHTPVYSTWPGAHALVTISVNQRACAILQVRTVAVVVPDSRITAIGETAPLRMIFIRIDPANLPWIYDKVGESKHVVSLIAQRPAVQLDRLSIIAANGNVLIRLPAVRSIVRAAYDNNVPCNS